MTYLRGRIVRLACLVAFGISVIASPTPVRAADTCHAFYVVLGQTPALTGPTPTDWFNVIGEDFDPSAPAVLEFGVPVIAWSLEQPTRVQPATTTFTVPQSAMGTALKWTFRARDAGAGTIDVWIVGGGCEASTTVDFSLGATAPAPNGRASGGQTPPATSTADGMSASSDRAVADLLLASLAFVGGLFAVLRRLAGFAGASR